MKHETGHKAATLTTPCLRDIVKNVKTERSCSQSVMTETALLGIFLYISQEAVVGYISAMLFWIC